jgi:hypothetical protein
MLLRTGSRRGRSPAAPLALAAILAAGCTAAPAPRAEPRTPARPGEGAARRAGSDGAARPAQGAARRCPEAPPYADPDPHRPRYRLFVDVSGDLVSGRLRVRFTPDLPTSRLVFRLWPNGPRQAAAGARLSTGAVTSGGSRLRARLADPTTLVVALGRRLQPGDGVTVALPWRLRVPGPVADRLARAGDTVRLGSFFPLLAWEPGRGWARDPPTTALAEASSSPSADFDVRVRAPRGAQVLASGARVGRRRWRAHAVRDFALAVGSFRTHRRTVAAPDPVTVTIGVAEGLGGSPRPFSDAVAAALRDLSHRLGPYPWEALTLAVVPGLGRAGIEYPTMIFQGSESLDWATTHEVAHSWFYALVGNNQARHPWLDEGLTTWSQGRADGTALALQDYPVADEARGHLGKPMSFWEEHESLYFPGVYVQGVRALAALGSPTLVDCALRSYVAANAYSVARPRDLVSSLRRVFPDAPEVLARFGVRS